MIDASKENTNYVAPGIQHKYRTIIAVIVSKDCLKECPWCFRRRLFVGDEYENDSIANIDTVISYIKKHPCIDSVLLTGGDALLADFSYLTNIITEISSKTQVKRIRLGTRAFLDSPREYLNMILSLSSIHNLEIVLHTINEGDFSNCHFSYWHVNSDALNFYSQTPLLKGVNDKPEQIVNLMNAQMEINIHPYYVFQCRAIEGNEKFSLTFDEALFALTVARSQLNGLAKRFRYVMSCDEGKLEILGIDGNDAILLYHQAKDMFNTGKIIRLPKEAVWYSNKRPIFLKNEKYTKLI